MAQVKVAILDTGLDMNLNLPLCEPVHNYAYGPQADSNMKHGSNVASIISQYAGPDTCLVIYRVFNNLKLSPIAYYNAFEDLTRRKDIQLINLSLSGTQFIEVESILLKELLDQGKLIVVAAGNEGHDLGRRCDIYPACVDPRLIVVGNSENLSSNHGMPVDVLENGANVVGGGVQLSGTSQAAAIHTGKLAHELAKRMQK